MEEQKKYTININIYLKSKPQKCILYYVYQRNLINVRNSRSCSFLGTGTSIVLNNASFNDICNGTWDGEKTRVSQTHNFKINHVESAWSTWRL